jgi:hypothetical protein
MDRQRNGEIIWGIVDLGSKAVKTYILFVWSCIACIVGTITMVCRWDLAMVEKEACASLCVWGRWNLREIRCLSPSWQVSGFGLSQLQVYANPN